MSNLYLYTFLATLLLLLTISMAIVGRSLYIRRRGRRVIEEAMRNGTLPPQAARPIPSFGDKPNLFDVYTTGRTIPGSSPLDDSPPTWANIKPLSAALKIPVPPSPQAPVSQSLTPTDHSSSLLLRLVPQLRPLSQTAVPGPHAYPLETLPPPQDPVLTVSVMIAMPTPPSVNPQNSPKDTFPLVLVGVTHLPLPRRWSMDAKSESG